MPTDPDDRSADLVAKTREVLRRMNETRGEIELVPRREPLHELISTMLSHRTTMEAEERAFQAMWTRYGSWERIRDADPDELAGVLAEVTFPEPKAARIQETLRRITAERGAPEIDFLAELPPAEGLAWLTALPGVGIKTASLVLLFCFAKPLLPVDTHVHRISQRVGLIGPKTSAEKAHRELLVLLPDDATDLYRFHVHLLRHGQQVCRWQTPRCGRCPLTDLCDWYAQNRA